MAELKNLYVKRNSAPSAPRGSWAEHVDELNRMSAGTMQQGETAGNGALGWLKDSADAGFFSSLGGTARLAGEFLPFGNETLNSWADKADEIARRNSPQAGQNLEGLDYVASAVGNALGSGAASALEAGAVAAAASGLGSLAGIGGLASTVGGIASKAIPGVGAAAKAGKTLWKSPMGKYLVANVAGSPFEAASEAGNLISDMRNENQQGTANYSDEEIRDAAIRSGALNLAWLTGMNMLEAGTLGKITGALGGDMAAKGVKDIAKRATLGGLSSGIGEGAEEYGQNLIGDYSKRGNTSDFNYDEALEAAKMGAIGGGVLGGIGSGLSAKFSKKNNTDVSAEVDSEGGTIEDSEGATTQAAGREAFINAIAGQESGGNYEAVNGRTGAAGKYQIMPENWPAWAEEAGLGADAEMTPENQEIVARYKLGEYYDKYGARGAAMAWYAGEGSLNYSEEALNRKQGKGDEPSINEYADSVLARMGNHADTARIDDREENYFDESNYTDPSILNATAPARGFDVSNIGGSNEAADNNSLSQFEQLSPEAKAQREAYQSEQRHNALMQEIMAAGNNPARGRQYAFTQQRQNPADILEHGFGNGNVETVNDVKAFDNNIQTNKMRKRAREGNAMPNYNFGTGIPGTAQNGLAAVQRASAIPTMMQTARSPREMANATNNALQYNNLLRQNYGFEALQTNNATQDLAGIDRLNAEVQREEDRESLGNLIGMIREKLPQKKAKMQAERQALVDILNARAAGQVDAAQQEYANRAKEQTERQAQAQAIANIVNARAAQQWDAVPTAEKFKFVPQRQSMYDGALRRNLAAQDRIQPDALSSVEPTPVNRRALEGRNFVENVIAAGRADYAKGKRTPVSMVGERRKYRASVEARNFAKEYANDRDKRDMLRNAAITVWTNDPKHPMRECRKNLNQMRTMRKEILQPIVDAMSQGMKQGVSLVPITEFDGQQRGRMSRASNNAPWYSKYYKEHKKPPTKNELYNIAEDVFFGNDEYGVGYYSDIKGQEIEQVISDNHDKLDFVNNAIEAFETLELKLKENPNYGKEWAAKQEAITETGETKTPRNSEAAKVKTEPTAKSDKDEVKAEKSSEEKKVEKKPEEQVKQQVKEKSEEETFLPKGITAKVNLNDKLHGVEVKFSDKPGPKVAKAMRDAGYKWSGKKQLWYSEQNNADSMAMAEKLGYKPAEEVEQQNRNLETERKELLDTFANKFGVNNILSVNEAKKKLGEVEGLNEKAIVYYDKGNKSYHIITKNNDAETLKSGYKYDVYEYNSNRIGNRVGAYKTVNEVIESVKGRTPSADIFSKNPDALIKDDKISSMPLGAMEYINNMFKKGEAKNNARETIRRVLFKDKDLKTTARNNTFNDFKTAYFNAVNDYLAGHVDKKTEYAELLNDNFAEKNMDRAAEETYNLLRAGMEKPEPQQKQAKAGEGSSSRFDGARARKSLDALIGRKKKNEPQKNDVIPKFMNVFNEDELDAEIEKAKKEMIKLSANPMFNPALMKSLFKIGGIYLQKGVNKFAAWADNMAEIMGEKVRPFLPAVWESLKKYPNGQKFNDDVMTAVMEYVGEGVDQGKTLSAIKREFADDYGEEYLSYVDSAYEGVKKYPTSDTSENVVQSNQENTEGGNENGNNTTRTGSLSQSERPEQVQGTESGEQVGRVPGQSDEQHERPLQRPENEPAQERPSAGGSNGTGSVSAHQGQGENSAGTAGRGAVPLTPAQKKDAKPSETPGHNYTVTKDSLGDGGLKTKYQNNIKAIKLLKQLEAEGRAATPAEQEILANYVGWGGLSPVFNVNYRGEAIDDSWIKEAKEIKELLTDEEYKAARASTTTAFYTPVSVIKNIYKALERIGFKGGKVLEPSMGTGNFFGVMPESMRSKSSLNGVELDSLTGRIAKQLYQKANIEITGFEKTNFPDGYFDLAISNVPFGSFRLSDSKYDKYGLHIHNYFFAKAMDKVRPGGLVCFVTSTDTMQGRGDSAKLRQLLKGKADFVGAIRLPDTTFKANANTEVTSDVIILQKRKEGAAPSKFTQEWLNTVPSGVQGRYDELVINEYYKNHPEMIIGELKAGGQWGSLIADGRNVDVEKAMAKAVNKLPANIYESKKSNRNNNSVESAQKFLAPSNSREGALIAKDGKVYHVEQSQLVEMPNTVQKKALDYIGLRDTAKKLLTEQVNPATTDEQLAKTRADLNKAYDKFVKEYGPVNDPKNIKKLSLDSDYGVLEAIEDYKVEPLTNKVTVTKRAIFSQRTVNPVKEIKHADNVNDALTLSMSQTGGVDLEYMFGLMDGKSKESILKELGERVYENPETNDVELAEAYLSGNVREKLEFAKTAAKTDKRFERNVEALKKIQPKDLEQEDISVSLGTPWIPESDIQAFTAHLFGNRFNYMDIKYIPTAGTWKVDWGNAKDEKGSVAATQTWGTKAKNIKDLLEAALNQSTPTVRVTDIDGKSHVDAEATIAAQAKLREIQDEFRNWIWTDKNRAERLLAYYNRNFNNWVLRNYDGSALNFPGYSAAEPQLKQHQKDVVWRILQDGTCLMAHCVGAGKTWSMQTAAMELKRLGLANKSMFVIPNHMLQQFENEFRRIYPNAKLLTISSDTLPDVNVAGASKLSKAKLNERKAAKNAKRQSILGKIATEDWDGIIISHNIFKRIPMSPEAYNRFYEQQIEEVEQAITDISVSEGGRRNNSIVKTLEKTKKNLESKLKQNVNEEAKDIVIPFEQLGIDQIFVDEADQFKNLYFTTRMQNIAGMSQANSQRSMDMFMKTQYLMNANNGRGVVFATGTPISNTMAEMFTMLRYLDNKGLKDKNLGFFDNWAATFATKETTAELAPDGSGYRTVEKFTKFNNMPELIKMFRKVADVKKIEDLDLEIPKLKNGKPTVVEIPMNSALETYIKDTAKKRATAIHNKSVDPSEDNMLKLTGDLRKASLDMRLVDPSVPASVAGGKIKAVVDHVSDKYKETSDVNGVQLVFCDLSTPKGASDKVNESDAVEVKEEAEDSSNITVYAEIKKGLIKKGIPANQIAFIHDAKNKTQKEQLFERCRQGQVRVLIGSTEKMGAGTNIQKKLVAEHHVDAPWRPRDIEQREGRILRQGNDNKEVEIFNYVTKGSFDANMWEKLKNKATMIGQAMSGNLVQRSIEDADATVLSFAEVEALASGNPLMAERVMVNAKLTQYEALAENYRRDQEKNKRALAAVPNNIKVAEDKKDKAQADIKKRVDISGDNFSMVIGRNKNVYTNRKDAKTELERIASHYSNELGGVVAKAGGFDIRFRAIPAGKLFSSNDGKTAYKASEDTVRAEIVGEDTYFCEPTQGSIEYAIMHAPDKALAEANRSIADNKELMKQLEAKINEPFKYANEYEELKKRSAEIEEELNKANEQYSISDEAITRSRTEVEDEIKKALSSAKLEQQADGSYIATMPNGKKLGIFIEDQILLNEQQAAEAGRAHNSTADEAEGYWNSWERLEGKNVDGVLRVSRNSRVGTAFHETLHAAMDLCLTSKEKAALYKSFKKKAQESGRSVDEEIADAYKDWAIKRQQGKGSMFGKLFQKAKDFLNKLYTMFVEAENKGNIFRKLESGKAWEQGVNKNSGSIMFSLLPNSIQKELLKRGKAFMKAVEDVKNGIRNGREIFTVCDTPLLLQKLGVENLPIQMSLGIAYNNTKKRNASVKHSHGVPFEVFEQMPKAIQDPVFVLKSATHPEDIVIYTDIKVDGKSIILPITLSKSTGRSKGNYIKSIYPKENDTLFLIKQAKLLNNVLYVNNKKSLTWLGQGRVQFPPELTKSSSSLDKIVAKELEEVNSNGDKIHYSVAPGNNKIASAFTNTERKGAIQSAKDFIKEQKKNFYTDMVDKNHILKSFDALTKATGGLSVYDSVQNLPSTTAGMLKAICEGDALSIKAANQHLKNVKMKHNVTLAMALDQINKKTMDKAQPNYLAANGFDSWVNAFGAYLGAERLLEMNDLAKAEGKVYKFPKGLTEAELKAFTRNVPPQFRKAADMFYKVNDNMISVMEDAQVFSPELAKALRTKYKKYCPLLRDFSDTAAADTFINGLTEGGRGIGNVSIPLKKINIEGSERGVMNPLESVLKSYSVMLNRAERNKVGLMAVNAAKTAQLHDLIKEMPEKKDVKGNVVNAVADPKNCIFTVLVNGKKKAYQTTQELYAPIVGYNLPAAGLCINVARMAAHMLRTGATMSPSFIVRNLLRDTVFAGISSKNGFIPIVDSIRGAMALWNDPAMRAEFEAAGVTEFNFYGSQNARIKSLDDMAGEKPVGLWEMIKWAANHLEAASDFVESSTRMGEFMKARKNGKTMEEAAREAREVTLDFSRSGVVGEQVNRYVPFFNACIQGGDKMVRLLKEDPWGTSQKLFQYIVLPSLFLWAMNHDEDWYKDLDPDVKNNYWLLGEHLRIPKPQEAGVLFGSGIEALLDQAEGKNKEALKNMAKVWTSNMVPGIVPTIFLPLLEWQANYSYFKGKALVGSKYQRLPDELQYNDYTSELSKAIGNNPIYKVSPMKVDNLIRGYTGTMGGLLWSAPDAVIGNNKNLPEKKLSERVFFRDFAVTDANKSRPMNDFYDILDKANRQHAGYGVKGKPAEAVKGIRAAGSAISKIRKDVDKITHSNLTPERKRELIDQRKEKMTNIARKATERYGKYFD